MSNFCHYPAKTYKNIFGDKVVGRSVHVHTTIVGHIAKRLIAQFAPEIRALFPKGSETLVAAHDIGKISPTFYVRLMDAAKRVIPEELKKYQNINEFEWGGHAGTSMIALKGGGHDDSLQTVVGQHHGALPSIGIRRANSDAFGGSVWQAMRMELIEALENEFDCELPDELNESQIRLISGLTCVADWIGSGKLFDNPNTPWEPLIDVALTQAGYIKPKLKKGLSFESVFGFEPREAQAKLIDACQKPGVYVLEAPMGIGKTEAALYCAYQALERGASGIYFALPTQLTSNKIYERFNQFLSQIIDEECPHRQALLAHSGALLVETELGKEGEPGETWFDDRKRKLLAPFAVGTLDQAAMSVMNVKHGFVRAYGLAGKVVILDEVHSYDAYTSVILDKMIALLVELGCTVIILSATLSFERRRALLNTELFSDAYPLITAITDEVKEVSITPPPSRDVSVKMVGDDADALAEAIKRAQRGEQVLWIENTVKEAQTVFAAFKMEGIKCGLLHSRFTAEDRARNEAKWVTCLGKEGWTTRGESGRIIVGTQVVEQSVDIDADFMVTRCAPTDMLLQRFGRLWRHEGTPRPPSARCEAWILAPSIAKAVENPYLAFGPSSYVYGDYYLCRSLEVWKSGVVCLPGDIRSLINATYSERIESGKMADYQRQLLDGTPKKKGLNQLRQIAKSAIATAGQTQSDTHAQTRYSKEDTGEILIVNAITPNEQLRQTHIELISGETLIIPWQKHLLTQKEWRKLSVKFSRQMVPCRASQLPQRWSYEAGKKLRLNFVSYIGQPESRMTYAILALNDSTQNAVSEKKPYKYSREFGLVVK